MTIEFMITDRGAKCRAIISDITYCFHNANSDRVVALDCVVSFKSLRIKSYLSKSVDQTWDRHPELVNIRGPMPLAYASSC